MNYYLRGISDIKLSDVPCFLIFQRRYTAAYRYLNFKTVNLSISIEIGQYLNEYIAQCFRFCN